LLYAAQLLNQVIERVEGIRIGLHVCRGNWSRDESVLLSGDYTPLLPMFQQTNVQQLVLEYATPRAGEIDVVGQALSGKEIGLGVVNPRTDAVESVQQIIERVEQALRYYTPEAVFLNPDCGFGCFANRCVNSEEVAIQKILHIVAAARQLREKYG
jgi:5-methyltetrahydropteroyltriglutamate--homocysteine methyltransferase